MRAWIVRAAREWPLWIAIAGLLSLLLLPRAVRIGASTGAAQRREIDELRADVTNDPASAENRLSAFLSRHAASPLAGEAQSLLARATLARARTGSFPGASALDRAWTILSKEAPAPETNGLRREAASLMAEFGMIREAVARFRELYDETRDADLALDLVPALSRLAALELELRHPLLDEASKRISDFLRLAAADRRVKGVLAQALLYREAKRDEDLLQLLVSELSESRNRQDRGLLQMERGRTFARLGRNMEAMSSFDEAEKLLSDPMDRGLAMVHQAELFARAANPECAELCRRIVAAESPASPLALLVAGIHELKANPSVALDSLKNGLSQIRRPRMIDDASFDFPWVHASIRAAAERETGEDRLVRWAGILGEIGRLQPLSTRVALDHAAILLRARDFEAAADRFLATGAVLQAADACAEGGLHLRAASLYRQYFDLQPGSNVDALFRRAMSLKKAGDSAGAMAGFEEYLAKAGPSGSSSGMALLEEAALQKPEDALATYDRVLKAREVTTSPARDDWALALLGRGRALLRLSRAPEARIVLLEYLERYAEGPAPAPASIEAAWLLVGAAIGERQWKAGLARLHDLELLASRVPDPDRAPYSDLLKEARFVEGDLHFNLEDYAASYRAYGEAVRRHADSEDRLWGLIGRARALARLERREEARRDYSNARAIFEGGALTGHGRDYWEIALDSLERELR